MGKVRNLKNIEVGIYQDKVGISLSYPDQEEKEHVLFTPEVALAIGREIIALATVLKNQGFKDMVGVKEHVKVELH